MAGVDILGLVQDPDFGKLPVPARLYALKQVGELKTPEERAALFSAVQGIQKELGQNPQIQQQELEMPVVPKAPPQAPMISTGRIFPTPPTPEPQGYLPAMESMLSDVGLNISQGKIGPAATGLFRAATTPVLPREQSYNTLMEIPRAVGGPLPAIAAVPAAVVAETGSIATTPLTYILGGLGKLSTAMESAAAKSAIPALQVGGKAANAALGAFFAEQTGSALYETGKRGWKDIQEQKWEDAAKDLGFGTVEGLLTYLGAAYSWGKGVEIKQGMQDFLKQARQPSWGTVEVLDGKMLPAGKEPPKGTGVTGVEVPPQGPGLAGEGFTMKEPPTVDVPFTAETIPEPISAQSRPAKNEISFRGSEAASPGYAPPLLNLDVLAKVLAPIKEGSIDLATKDGRYIHYSGPQLSEVTSAAEKMGVAYQLGTDPNDPYIAIPRAREDHEYSVASWLTDRFENNPGVETKLDYRPVAKSSRTPSVPVKILNVDADVSIDPNVIGYTRPLRSSHIILSVNGIYENSYTSQWLGGILAPRKIFVDLKPANAEEQGKLDTALNSGSKSDVDNALTPLVKKMQAELGLSVRPGEDAVSVFEGTPRMLWDALPTFKAAPSVKFYDRGLKLSEEETNRILNDPHIGETLKYLEGSTKLIFQRLKSIKGRENLTTLRGVAITTDPTILACFVGHPGDTGQFDVYYNLFKHFEGRSPHRAADELVHTIIHEITHQVARHRAVGEPDIEFDRAYARSIKAIPPSTREALSNGFRKAFSEFQGSRESLNYRPSLYTALQTVRKAEGRLPRQGSLIWGEDSGSDIHDFASMVQKEGPVGTPGGGTGDLGQGHTTGRGKIAGTESTGGVVRAEDLGEFGVTSPEYGVALTEQLAKELPPDPEPPPSDEDAQRELQFQEFTKSLGLTEGPAKPKPPVTAIEYDYIAKNTVKWNRYYKYVATLIQLGEANPKLVELQQYINYNREAHTRQLATMIPGDNIAKKWMKLGRQQANAVSELALEATVKSWRLRRKLKPEEIARLALRLKVDERGLTFYREMMQSMSDGLDLLQEALINRAKRDFTEPTDAEQLDEVVQEIVRQFDHYRDRTYFPLKRFGKHVAKVRTKAPVVYGGLKYPPNRIIYEEHFDTGWERDQRLKELEAEFAGPAYIVFPDSVSDLNYAFADLPPALLDKFRKRLKLSSEQWDDLRQLVVEMAPARSFQKSLKKRRSVKGFSHDAIRSYSSFMMQLGRHIARTDYSDKMQQAISDLTKAKAGPDFAKIRDIQNSMREHFRDIMNPSNDFTALNTFLFHFYFVLVPEQVLANLTQFAWGGMPACRALMTGSEFTKDARLLRHAERAINDAFQHWRGKDHLSEEEVKMFERADADGTTNQSYPSEIVGLAHGVPLKRLLPVEAFGLKLPLRNLDRAVVKFTEYGILPWKVSEIAQRKASILMAYRILREQGTDIESAYQQARALIDRWYGEYSTWNRGYAFRKFRSVLMFKSMIQFVAHNLYTFAPGAALAFLALVVIGGPRSIPGFSDLEGIINAVGSRLGWGKKLYFDLETWTHELMQGMMINPDGFWYGLGGDLLRPLRVFPQVDHMLPILDISTKIAWGGILPLGATEDLMAGKKIKGDEFVLRTIKETVGAGGGYGYNVARAMLDDTPRGHLFRRFILPAFLKNLVEGAEMFTKKETSTASGDPLAHYDPSNPADFIESLAKGLSIAESGKNVAEVRRRWKLQDALKYYTGRRAALINDWYFAKSLELEREAQADSYKAIQAYNKTAPEPFGITSKDLANYRAATDKAVEKMMKFNEGAPPEFAIQGQQLRDFYRSQAKKDILLEEGLPLSRRSAGMNEEYQRLYPPVRPKK